MNYVPSQGDIVWIDFDPQSGHEQKGRRPALVISNNFFNNKTGLAMMCPITNTTRNYPLWVSMDISLDTTGYIMVEQVKAIDYVARHVEFKEKVEDRLVQEVIAKINCCF